MESSFSDPVPAGTRLIETFGWWPASGIPRFERHIARLSASADMFGYRVDRRHIDGLVASLASEKALRCRLTLGSDGVADLTYSILPDAPNHVWRLELATGSVTSNDPWLRHKSTNRRRYDRARSELPEDVDEVLFLNERSELCEGTITNLFVTLQDGRRVTPAVASGCLPGILRQELLEAGKVTEAVVTLDMLANARKIQVGNALRGQIDCELVHPIISRAQVRAV